MKTSLSWLSCTRYCPPRIPIQKENGLKKRRVGRQARIPFTSEQLKTLEDYFQKTPYLNAVEVKQISSALHLGENRVKIWFQNRRARERRERYGNYERPEMTKDNIIPIPATIEPTSSSLLSESTPSTSRTNMSINNITYESRNGVSSSDTASLSHYSLVYTSEQPSSHQTLNFTDETRTTFSKYSRIEHPI
ncbi:homeobox protein MSX-2-like [Agrilus planipennis]|uniref:Homeobox protein MSX-2-like n=1 Tax=Agrilus planipennis TaxID=224129 RepID=A0A7F5R4Z1_AGRPL|nr:homeobox protein MSX-2-like [Agrilus planipennis]